MTDQPIIIAGGGIGGLAAALACAEAGRKAVVLERAPAFEEVGAGLQIGPNAVHALEVLGAWPEVARIATAPPSILMQGARSETVLRRIGLDEAFASHFGAPYRVAHRADLHAALLACARRSPLLRILTGQEITGTIQVSRGISVTTAGGVSHTGELLVAADGMNSSLRQKLWPDSAAVPAGQILHRALIDLPKDLPEANSVQLWMGPGYHVVHYPVGAPARLNIICVAHAGQSPQDIAARAGDGLRGLLLNVPNWLPWEAKFVPPLAEWHRDGVMLLGDAAHGTVPFFAQGAAMALEDAALLCQTLKRGAARDEILACITSRIPRVRAVHAASIKQGKIYSASGLVAAGRNVALRLMPEGQFFSRLDWLYNYRG